MRGSIILGCFLGILFASSISFAGECDRWTQPSAWGSSGRTGHGMAYDAARRDAVLFGGGGEFVFGDTWTFDGQAWTQRFPDHSPRARYNPSMTYDSLRGVVVLIGGTTQSDQAAFEHWEWNGEDWTLTAMPDVYPGTRFTSPIVFDSARSRIVGYLAEDSRFETWEFDGSTWAQVSTTGPATYGAALVYDSARGVTVLFGNYHDTRAETWEWDGNSWALRVVNQGPAPREEASMFFDGERCVLFGGHYYEQYFADTWAWDGTSWTEITDTGPSARAGQICVFDEPRGQAILFGGNSPSSPIPSDTWVFRLNLAGDLTADGDVDLGDLGEVLSAYGRNAGGDTDGDGDTDLSDLGVVLSEFGQTCP